MSGDLILSTEPPLLAPELIAYAEQCRMAFGLEEWKIWLYEHDMPGGDANTAGHTELETRYLRATVTLLRGLKPDRAREVLRHELLHIALAWIAQVVEYAQSLLTSTQRTLIQTMYTDVEEQTIQRLARALPTGALYDPADTAAA